MPSAPPSPDRAVLLMALGAPTGLDDVGDFLKEVRGGRTTPPDLVAEFAERYRRIGGRSPLLDVSRAQARAVESRLAALGSPRRCAVGMRHGLPRIEEALRELVAGGAREVTGVCLSPYYSDWSVGGYLAALDRAADRIEPRIRVRPVQSWNRDPALIAAFREKIVQGLRTLAGQGVTDPVLLFTAHSLPGVTDPEREPYVLQLAETRRALQAQFPSHRSRMAFQSVGRRAGDWLGPDVGTVLAELGGSGERGVLVIPYGFISDNLEILYDVDIELRTEAQRRGVAFARTESLNDAPGLAEAVANAIVDAESAGDSGP